jgi:beta-xylosidase
MVSSGGFLKNKRKVAIGVSLVRASAAFLLAFGSATYPYAQSIPRTDARFSNPLLWEDLPDLDIVRVDDAYYYSASNMHYSPGAPILRSYDLLNWEYVGHSIPVLDFSPAYNLDGGRAYVKGSWASFLGYRRSNKTFYWGGCIEFSKTHIYTAPAAEGPWQKKAVIDNCYYDAGLLIDDDDTMYVAYGNKTLSVAQLSADGTQQVKTQVVFQTPPEIGVLEGSRFYKVNGNYYIFNTRPANAEYVLKSTRGPFGPYEIRVLLKDTKIDIPGAGVPHQGGVVQTQKGDWYYMAFVDAFPGGRMPVLAPLTWGADGWPTVQLTENTWPMSYPMPDIPKSSHPVKPPVGTDSFQTSALDSEWEWNHNPNNSKWSTGHGLTLQTATVTDDLYSARNTLTHRILGPSSTATIIMDESGMKDGDYAGLAMFRDSSAWIGVTRDRGKYRLVMRQNITLDQRWNTATKGDDVVSVPISGAQIWLRAAADIRPGTDRTAVFSYSMNGKTFTPLGQPFVLNNRWQYFMGYRYAIFNYATKALGGVVKVESFTMSAP